MKIRRRDSLDRELLYLFMWKHTDKKGILLLSQQEIADRLGVHKITITKIMKELRDLGLLQKKGNLFKVLNPEVTIWGLKNE